MKSRWPIAAVALACAAIVGGVVALAAHGDTTVAQSMTPPVSTTSVVRTDLASTTLTGGTLGFAPTQSLVNRLAGTYTHLPPVGATIGAGQVLYRVDDQPVVLMSGTIPAWRDFASGMSAGPDISQLQANLIALGNARGLLTSPSGQMNAATVSAVDRWQISEGIPVTGIIPLGQIQFLPSTVLVGAAQVTLGQSASPGDNPLQLTTTTRTVVVPLTPNLPTVTAGEEVSIVLPTGATTPGKVTAIEPVPPGGTSSSTSSSNSSNSSQSSSSQAATEAIVTPDDPSATGSNSQVAVQVSLTVVAAHDVLAVPVSALLALAGGGYGLEVVGPHRTHDLMGVTTGIFAGSMVQVTGHEIEAGTRVVVAQ